MGQLVFQATLGGQVNLVGPNTASTYNINVPAVAGTLVTTGDTGTVTNTMLAGLIANAKLTNSSVTIGSTSVALGATASSLAGLTDVSTSTLTASGAVTVSAGTANGVGYLNGSKVLTTGSALTFDGSNLGLGTSSPSSVSNYGAMTINGTNGGLLDLKYGNTLSGRFVASTGSVGIECSSTNYLYFYLNGSERARIDSSGNLLVGQTSLAPATLGASMAATGIISGAVASSSSATTSYNLYSTTAGAYRFYVDMAGTIHATSIVITAISDQRLKENVRDIDTGLNTVLALKPRRFDWKKGKGQDKKNAAGFIAQEFEEVFPECVGTSKAGEDGIEYKNINYETLIPTLVKAIQEQQTIIESLKARLDAANL